MAKTTKRRSVKSKTKKVVRVVEPSLLSSSSKGPWGKDQPMVLILSAGIIILIVVSLYVTGWI